MRRPRVTKKRRAEVAAVFAVRYTRRLAESVWREMGDNYERDFWKRLETLTKSRGRYASIGYPQELTLDRDGFRFRGTGDDYQI